MNRKFVAAVIDPVTQASALRTVEFTHGGVFQQLPLTEIDADYSNTLPPGTEVNIPRDASRSHCTS